MWVMLGNLTLAENSQVHSIVEPLIHLIAHSSHPFSVLVLVSVNQPQQIPACLW